MLASPADGRRRMPGLAARAATAAALGRTEVMTFSPLSPRLDTCIANLPSAAGLAPSLAASFSRRMSIALGRGRTPALGGRRPCRAWLGDGGLVVHGPGLDLLAVGRLARRPSCPSAFLSSGRLPWPCLRPLSRPTDATSCRATRRPWPRRPSSRSASPPMAVASGAPVSLRLTPILKPGEVGPSWATTRPEPGSAAARRQRRRPAARLRRRGNAGIETTWGLRTDGVPPEIGRSG